MKYLLISTYVFFLSASTVLAVLQPSAYSGKTLESLVKDDVWGFVNPLAGLMVSITVLIFLFNMARYVWTAGDSKAHAEAVQYIGWSLLGLFVMFSLWGLVNILSYAFFGV